MMEQDEEIEADTTRFGDVSSDLPQVQRLKL